MPPLVLILAPTGRDAPVAASILRTLPIETAICGTLEDTLQRLPEAHCLVVTAEALLNVDRTPFAAWLGQQPAWSDFPIVLLTSHEVDTDGRLNFLDEHVIALERPFQATTLVNSVRTAIRARERQFEVKAFIDEKTELSQRQTLLIRELHHRVKNTLANVQAMMRATAHGSTDMDAFMRDFSSRLVSLSETHSMLTDDYWQTASLASMLSKELGHYDVLGSNRVTLDGPDVQLVADLAIPLGMGIHELASNSSRHGSLSRADGRLAISWERQLDDGAEMLDLHWLERDGPPVSPPTRQGFGTTLLQRVLAVQCEASVDLRYEPEGFSCRLQLPLRQDRLVPIY